MYKPVEIHCCSVKTFDVAGLEDSLRTGKLPPVDQYRQALTATFRYQYINRFFVIS